jgi:hypothetical protein
LDPFRLYWHGGNSNNSASGVFIATAAIAAFTSFVISVAPK